MIGRRGTVDGERLDPLAEREFLAQLDPQLGELRSRLCAKAHTIDRAVGGLTADWAKRTGLPEGIPVAPQALADQIRIVEFRRVHHVCCHHISL